MRVDDLQSIKVKMASPKEILGWSRGEVTKAETINYRTQRAEKDGLFDEVIFGPEKDYQCYCGKYKRIRYKGIICDRCGVEVTTSSVRRERMGHIKLSCPVSHIWFLRGVPSRMGLVLNIPGPQLEKVIYFASYIVISVNEKERSSALAQIEREFKEKTKEGGFSKEELKKARDEQKQILMGIKPLLVISEIDYQKLSLKYGHIFEAGTGAETVKKIFEKIDLKEEIKAIKNSLPRAAANLKRKLYLRLRLFEGLEREGLRPEWMFMEVLPVLPPDLRPMVQLDGGRFASSDLNDLYRRVINRNNRLKYLLEIFAPDVIVRNEKRMLQEAVDALIDNSMRRGTMIKATTGGKRLLKSLADMLKGKQGRFRQNLLGKRVDYSGRSVIVVGPELQLHQVGLPKKMALELFRPFVIRKILERELAFNLRGASRLIDEGIDEVWAILEEVVQGKLVLLNRAPTLHRLGIQAFEPILIEGSAIQLHPLVCKAYNADFDGDQMAVHVPLSDSSQEEARTRIISTKNLLKPATGKPIVSPTQEMVMGCYWISRVKDKAKGEGRVFSSGKEAILAWEIGAVDLRASIRVRMNYGYNNDDGGPKRGREAKGQNSKAKSHQSQWLETTVGRILFNEALPEDYPYQNEDQGAKKIEAIIADIINRYPSKTVELTLDKIKRLGFNFATLSGMSWGMDDLIVPNEKKEVLEEAQKQLEKIEQQFNQGLLSREERRVKIIEVWQSTKTKIEKIVPQILPKDGPVHNMIESGSRGSWIQVIQMCGMKGLVINPAGQIIELPVRSSYKEGLSVLEYFISTHGARKGTVDTALRTSTAGYLTRRLVDVAHEVIVKIDDCKDSKGAIVRRAVADEIGQNFVFKIVGRLVLDNIKLGNEVLVKKGQFIDWEAAKRIADSKISQVIVRSPLSCRAMRGVCAKCYGWDLANNAPVSEGEAVGIVAAQAIGEPGTQLTMKTFHTGGVAAGGDITIGLPRVEEIFEARSPGGKAPIARVNGVVKEITRDFAIKVKPENPLVHKGKNKNRDKKTSLEEIEYKVPAGRIILVKKGDMVQKGQPLAEGSLDIKELFKLTDTEKAQEYIVQEVQRIYVSQGVSLHDKHIEIIVRQMFSRVRIKEELDSRFIPGQIVSLSSFLKECKALKKAGKTPPKGRRLLLGISRVALTTDSFLSAASFQETSRILIRGALEGKEDKLRGLKENVIIGKLIPAGTGFKE